MIVVRDSDAVEGREWRTVPAVVPFRLSSGGSNRSMPAYAFACSSRICEPALPAPDVQNRVVCGETRGSVFVGESMTMPTDGVLGAGAGRQVSFARDAHAGILGRERPAPAVVR